MDTLSGCVRSNIIFVKVKVDVFKEFALWLALCHIYITGKNELKD